MTGDVEALRIIKTKEDEVDSEIKAFSSKQEELLEAKRKELEEKVEAAKEEAQHNYGGTLENLRKDVSKRASAIVDSAQKDADSIKLKISKSELEKIVKKLILSYVEE